MENLLRQDFDAFSPRYVLPTDRHLERPTPQLLFPGYVFVLIDPSRWWGPINNTRGVLRLLVAGGYPMSVTDEEMARVLALRPPLRRGDAPPSRDIPTDAVVRVRDRGSPFFEVVGTVSGMTRKQRVRVVMSLLSRDVEVVFDLQDVDVLSLPKVKVTTLGCSASPRARVPGSTTSAVARPAASAAT